MKKILKSLPEMQYVVDRQGILRYLKFGKGFKGSIDPVKSLGKPAESVLVPDIAPLITKKIQEVFKTGSDGTCEYSLFFPESPHPLHFRAHLTRLDSKEVLVSVRNVTTRVVAEKKLVESENRYRRLFELSPLPKLVLDVETHRFLDVNTAAQIQYGYSKAEFLRLSPLDIFSTLKLEQGTEPLTTGMPCEEISGSWKHRKIDGTIFQVEIFCHQVTFNGREARVLICHDVTDQVEARQALEESEEKFRSVFHTNPDAVSLSRMEDGILLEVNQGFLDFSGYTREEVIGNSTLDLKVWPDPDKLPPFIEKLLEEGKVKDFESAMQDRNGNSKPVLLAANIVRLGNKPHVLTVARDISEIKKAQQALQLSEEKFRKAFMASPDSVTISRFDSGLLVDVNEGFEKITGFRREEAVGKTSFEIKLWMDPKERELLEAPLRERGITDNVEIRYRGKDGRVIFGLTSASLISLEGVNYILSITRDVTQIRKDQIALGESEQRFQAIFNTSPNAILLVDMETRKITDVNQGFILRSGYTKEEVLGKSTEDIGVWEDPLDREELYRILKENGEVEAFEGRFLMKDGTLERGLLSARPMQLDGRPILLVTISDVSSLLETQKKLRASVAEKEVLLREVHHRVKNNLQVILGLLNLQEHHLKDKRGQQIFKESQNRILTMSLIHEVLYQSRDLARVNFQEYLVGLTKNLFSSYGVSKDQITLELDIEKTEVAVDTAIPCGLIINELVSNALKYGFPNGRKGTIKVFFKSREPHGYRLEVRDNGVGIPPELDFTKIRSLGLQLVLVLLEQLGGKMELDNVGGTAFHMEFEEYQEAGAMLY